MTNHRAGGFFSSVTRTHHPQVADYRLTAPAGSSVGVEFGLTTDYGTSTWEVPAPPGGGEVSILVAGMLASSTYHIRARVRSSGGPWENDEDHVFQTGALPAEILPTLQVERSAEHEPSPGVELINIIEPSHVSVVADLAGNILWYYNNAADQSWEGYAFPIKPLLNGHMLANVSNMYTLSYQNGEPQSVLREVDLAGDTVSDANGPRELYLASLNEALQRVPTPRGSIVEAYCYSHDVLPLTNGHYILVVQEQKVVPVGNPPRPLPVMGDAIVDLDEHYKPVWVWSAFDHLDVDRHPYEFNPANNYDWTHCNAVVAAPDGNLLVSLRNQSWVLKLNYRGGEGDGDILWTLGYEGSFQLAGGDPEDWFAAQHFPHVFAVSGPSIDKLAVFDNGNDRVGTERAPYSRALVLSLNESALTASTFWKYLPALYSFWGGDVVELPNGDIEICMSEPHRLGSRPTRPRATNVPPSQVLELTYTQENPQTVWHMTVSPGHAYRSYRVPSLYPGVQW